MARQTIKKPISRQGGPQVQRPIFGLNCEILHRTGGWRRHRWLESCCGAAWPVYEEGWHWSPVVHCTRGQGPDTTLVLLLLLRYNLKAPQQHGTSGQAKECLPSCQQQLPKVVTNSCKAVKLLSPDHPFTPQKPFHTSLVDHLSSSCQSQALAAETFEKK